MSVRWLRKWMYWTWLLATSARYHTMRRFTRPGLAVLIATMVSAALGVDMDQTTAYQAFTVLGALLMLAILGAVYFRCRFSAHRVLPRYGTVGQPLTYSIEVKNDSGRPQAGLILMENLADPRPGFEEFASLQMAVERSVRSFRQYGASTQFRFSMARVVEAPIPPLPAGGTAGVRMELMPLRRGSLRFEGVTVARPDPLGLVKALARRTLPQSLLILPKRYPLPPIALPGREQYLPGGVALASSVGESEEFVSLRDYRAGDALRRIHWRSWARVGEPVVKECEDEFFVRHALVLDTFAPATAMELFEEAVSVAASFACTVQTQESLLDLLFVEEKAYCFTAGRGLGHPEQMLEILASVRANDAKPFDALEHLVLDHVEQVSGCVCILLAWDEKRRRLVEKLQFMGVPLLVLVLSEKENPGWDAGPLRDQPGAFHILTLGAVGKGLDKL
jgi:uncharacterized protein (DUF58 family)